ncbi:hypothetical protein ACFSC3_08090 [Sphingomonas floccifaciens]|uniref:Uncharacterized protein n=1 Tax=Sphingomonas floccifaciens TaxID=1844115 RepID=A0ABW4ND86_9SPHN
MGEAQDVGGHRLRDRLEANVGTWAGAPGAGVGDPRLDLSQVGAEGCFGVLAEPGGIDRRNHAAAPKITADGVSETVGDAMIVGVKIGLALAVAVFSNALYRTTGAARTASSEEFTWSSRRVSAHTVEAA